MAPSVCANCAAGFVKKTKGYHRHHLDSTIQTTGKPARVHLQELIGTTISPMGRFNGEFLCPACWNNLSHIAKYQQACADFFASTKPTSFVGRRRPQSEVIDTESPNSDRPSASFLNGLHLTSATMKAKGEATRTIKTSHTIEKTPKQVTIISAIRPKPSKWDTIITAIRARQHRRAIKGIYNATAGTKRHFSDIAGRIVRKEVSDLLLSGDFPLCQDVDISSIEDFSWDRTIDCLSKKAPLLFKVVRGAVTKKHNQGSLARSNINLKPQIGTSMAILLHSRAPRKANFLQTLISVRFMLGGLKKRETSKHLFDLGLGVSYETTLDAINKVRRLHSGDEALKRLKEKISMILQNHDPVNTEEDIDPSNTPTLSVPNVEDEIDEPSDMDSDQDTVLYSDNDDDNMTEEMEDQSDDEDGDEEDQSDDEDGDEENSDENDLDAIEDSIADESLDDSFGAESVPVPTEVSRTITLNIPSNKI